MLIRFGVLAVVVLALMSILLWFAQQPVQFRLQVSNESGAAVDYVRLFGEGVETAASIHRLPSGESAEMVVELLAEGGLQFEVAQGMTRVDSYIARDVSGLVFSKRLLTVQPGNRYILSESAPLVVAD